MLSREKMPVDSMIPEPVLLQVENLSSSDFLLYNLVKWQFSKEEIIVREKPVGEQGGRLRANLPL